MKKKGFVLIETIIVLLVVAVSLVGLYRGYSLIFLNMKQKQYYDNVNDVYKVNILRSAFLDELTLVNNSDLLIINNDNCISSGMKSDCSAVLDNLGIDYTILTSGIIESDIIDSNLTNSDKAYMNFLENDKKYLIIVYAEDDKNYYASLRVG